MKKGFTMVEFLVVAVIAIILISIPISCVASKSNQEDVNITVKEKIVKNTSKSSKYLIFTNGEVFENTDDIVFLKYNSSDIQSQLEVGKSYNVRVAGFRVPFLSWYRNIIKINNQK